jgi:hypothetical protein
MPVPGGDGTVAMERLAAVSTRRVVAIASAAVEQHFDDAAGAVADGFAPGWKCALSTSFPLDQGTTVSTAMMTSAGMPSRLAASRIASALSAS